MGNLAKNKICTKCGTSLPALIGNFYKDIQKKDGLSSSCADCCRKRKYETFINITSEKLKEERRLKKETYLKSDEYQMFLAKSKEKEKIRKKRYRDKNREILNQKARLSIKKKPSPEKIKEYKKKEYEKIKANPLKKHIHYLRVRMNDCLKNKKQFSVNDVICYNHEEFLNHITSLFTEGMSWENYGKKGWHIDHIRPLASFNLENIEDVKRAFSLQNLQPLWSSENCSKGSLYEGIRHKTEKAALHV
jgi:hypothetical protein